MTTLIIEPPCDFINANQRLHFQAKAKLTKAWREAAMIAALAVRDLYETYPRAHVVITYRLADDRRREVSNLQPTSKAILDGIVDSGLLVDDSDAHVIGPDNRRERPNGPPRATVTIKEAA